MGKRPGRVGILRPGHSGLSGGGAQWGGGGCLHTTRKPGWKKEERVGGEMTL